MPLHCPPQCQQTASGRSPGSRVVLKAWAVRLPTPKRSGCVIRPNSPTVAGVAPELFVNLTRSGTHRLPVSSLGWIPLEHLEQESEYYIKESHSCAESGGWQLVLRTVNRVSHTSSGRGVRLLIRPCVDRLRSQGLVDAGTPRARAGGWWKMRARRSACLWMRQTDRQCCTDSERVRPPLLPCCQKVPSLPPPGLRSTTCYLQRTCDHSGTAFSASHRVCSCSCALRGQGHGTGGHPAMTSRDDLGTRVSDL